LKLEPDLDPDSEKLCHEHGDRLSIDEICFYIYIQHVSKTNSKDQSTQ